METQFPGRLYVFESVTNFILIRTREAREIYTALLEMGIAGTAPGRLSPDYCRDRGRKCGAAFCAAGDITEEVTGCEERRNYGETKETRIQAELDLDGGAVRISTGIGFLTIC